MDINKYVKWQAPKADSGDKHDKNYAFYLKDFYNRYKDLEVAELKAFQRFWRDRQDGSHKSIAAAMITFELIREKANEM